MVPVIKQIYLMVSLLLGAKVEIAGMVIQESHGSDAMVCEPNQVPVIAPQTSVDELISSISSIAFGMFWPLMRRRKIKKRVPESKTKP